MWTRALDLLVRSFHFFVVSLRYTVSNVFVSFEINVTLPFFVFPCSFWSK